jgi:hypothetical protein
MVAGSVSLKRRRLGGPATKGLGSRGAAQCRGPPGEGGFVWQSSVRGEPATSLGGALAVRRTTGEQARRDAAQSNAGRLRCIGHARG